MKKQNKTILSICAKCSDMYSHDLLRKDGKVVSYQGYVPSFFPGNHYGDYLILDIDPYSGKIINWKPWKKSNKRKGK